MIICKKCGNELSDDSVFCNKCGAKIEQQIEGSTANLEIKKDDDIKNTNPNSLDKIKGKKRIIGISITLLIIIAGIIVYFVYNSIYNQHLLSAKAYYDMSEYEKAYDEIKNFSPKKEDKNIFDSIDILSTIEEDLDIFNNEINFTSPDMEFALTELLSGLDDCSTNENDAKKLSISDKLDSIKSEIINDLSNYFNLAEEGAIKINKMDSKDRDKVIKEFAQKGIDNLNNIDIKNLNPIEIEDAKMAINGGYIYYTGAVKNVSNEIHSYV